MDRKRVAAAIGAVVLALGMLVFSAMRNSGEPPVTVVAPGTNARTEDAPEH